MRECCSFDGSFWIPTEYANNSLGRILGNPAHNSTRTPTFHSPGPKPISGLLFCLRPSFLFKKEICPRVLWASWAIVEGIVLWEGPLRESTWKARPPSPQIFYTSLSCCFNWNARSVPSGNFLMEKHTRLGGVKGPRGIGSHHQVAEFPPVPPIDHRETFKVAFLES